MARSIVDDEWPYMREGHDGFGHVTTRTRVQALNDTLRAIDLGDPRARELAMDAIRAADQIEDRLRVLHSREDSARTRGSGMGWAITARRSRRFHRANPRSRGRRA